VATRAGKRPEQRSAVGIAALAIQRLERVPADYLIRYPGGERPPLTELAAYGGYAPNELARYTSEQGVELTRR
jgi:hypothetical protein